MRVIFAGTPEFARVALARLHDAGFEIALVTGDVAAAHARAVAAGAREMAAPVAKPWGQVVSYVRCPDGVLVELCTPVGS